MKITPVILCGGSGSRLWPLSRENYPKQLLKLNGNHTMLQATALRLAGAALDGVENVSLPILVGNEDHRFLLAEQLREVGISPKALILEPSGRNTAPALTLAALAASNAGDDPVMVVMPADHIIQDEVVFRVAVTRGSNLAAGGKLVTFGVRPTGPETGYGYIRRGAACSDSGYAVAQFVEKPDAEVATQYVASGDYLWNAGIFAIKASVWLAKIRQLQPAMADACQRAYEGRGHDLDFVRPDAAAFSSCPADSIDYAVMEPLTAQGANSGEVVVVPLDARWSDVGAWSALWDVGDKDAAGNVIMGDVLAVDSVNTLVVANNRLVACIGLKDMVVVETPDAILVADRSQAQKIKAVVEQLKNAGRVEGKSHRKVYRPWGWYDGIDSGERFQVKRIQVNPGAAISLQMHHHRAEHWVVVKGTARVMRGDVVILLAENESTYIPIGTTHRLENPGKVPLEIIEVQSGSYLGEDDIVRFEDMYGRQG
jgi:mannose-1-phosphate guanylyltransferase / mannose-6-phosphate isomerase